VPNGGGRRPASERGRNGGRAPPRGQIVGRVVDAEGEPVEEAQLLITEGPTHPDIAALTASDGRFALGGLAAGTYRLRAQATGFAACTAVVVLTPGSRSVFAELALDREAAVPPRRAAPPAEVPTVDEAEEIPGRDE